MYLLVNFVFSYFTMIDFALWVKVVFLHGKSAHINPPQCHFTKLSYIVKIFR